jgi:hypothetical protein
VAFWTLPESPDTRRGPGHPAGFARRGAAPAPVLSFQHIYMDTGRYEELRMKHRPRAGFAAGGKICSVRINVCYRIRRQGTAAAVTERKLIILMHIYYAIYVDVSSMEIIITK